MQNYFITNNNRKLPKYLAYKQNNIHLEYTFPKKTTIVDLYKIADTKTGKAAGHMYTRVERNCINDEIYPNVPKCDSLYIEEIFINNGFRKKGAGTALINIAKAESKAQKCLGRVHLIVTAAFDRDNPAHIFYRKKGFKTIYNHINAKLDDCIKNKKQPDITLQAMYMYLPIGDKAPVAKRTIIKNFFMKLFKTAKKL